MDSPSSSAAADRSVIRPRSNSPSNDNPIVDYRCKTLILAPESPTSPSSPFHSSIPVPPQDLVILSHSPHRRPKRLSGADESLEPATSTPRRTGKRRDAPMMGCVSPKKTRRARRRLEKELVREEREPGPLEDDKGRARKRRQCRPKVSQKENTSLGPPIPSLGPLPGGQEITDGIGCSRVDGLQELIFELLMWKDVAKSTLWFGIGSVFFISSSFSREFSFSIISTASHLGILILTFASFYDSLPRRQQLKWRGGLQLTEEDILRAARVVLPMVNAALAMVREIFSGEASMTLKVAPILLFTAKYGHLITMWRLVSTGFFLSFTAPRLYSNYSQQIHGRVQNMRKYVCEAWKSCRHKKFIAASAVTVFWNLFSVKARILTAFISVVLLRYHRQQHTGGGGGGGGGQRNSLEEQQQAMITE